MKRKKVWMMVLTLGMLGTFSKTSWADYPHGDLTAERSGQRVRLDLTWTFHSYPLPGCEVDMERVSEDTGRSALVFSGDLGEQSFRCECQKWWSWEEGMEDATGRQCTHPEDSSLSAPDLQGDCPDHHSCSCKRVCEPFYNKPCNGIYEYQAIPHVFPRPGWSGGFADITVDWAGDCSELGGCGGGCSNTKNHSQVLMGLIFLLATFVPLLIRRARKRQA